MRPDDKFLYVMGLLDGPVKIDTCSDPDARMRQIRSKEGRKDVFLVETVPVDPGWNIHAERYAHWQLRDYHFGGEWFGVPSAKAVEAIKAAAEIGLVGMPLLPPLTGKWRPPLPYDAGLRDRIDAVLEGGGSRTAFMEAACEREIKRREAAKERKRRKGAVMKNAPAAFLEAPRAWV
jgi:hypothetical protein